nr:hypothetical protein K-LCC10_0210 [Kaumoebavirus]
MDYAGTPSSADYIAHLQPGSYTPVIFFTKVDRREGLKYVMDYVIMLGEINGKYTLPLVYAEAPLLSYAAQTLGMFGSLANTKYVVWNNNLRYIAVEMPFAMLSKTHISNELYQNMAANAPAMQQLIDKANLGDQWYGKDTVAALTTILPDVYRPFDNIAYFYASELVKLPTPPPPSPPLLTPNDEFMARIFCVNNKPAPSTQIPLVAGTRYERSVRYVEVFRDIVDTIRNFHHSYLSQTMKRKFVVVSTKTTWT